MAPKIRRIVYCSRSLLAGKEADVTIQLLDILDEARNKNPTHQITGALLFHAGNFAQVVEGPAASLDHLIDAVGRDRRNTDVTVALDQQIEERDFPTWAMAFAGASVSEKLPSALPAIQAVFAHEQGAGEKMLIVLKNTIVRDGNWFV